MSLNWKERQDKIVYADTKGLRWSYYIKPEEGKFELALIDNSGNVGSQVRYTNLEFAKSRAQNHFLATIKINS